MRAISKNSINRLMVISLLVAASWVMGANLYSNPTGVGTAKASIVNEVNDEALRAAYGATLAKVYFGFGSGYGGHHGGYYGHRGGYYRPYYRGYYPRHYGGYYRPYYGGHHRGYGGYGYPYYRRGWGHGGSNVGFGFSIK